MSLDNKKILIVGGTGLLGRPVVQIFDHFGFPVRILSRNPEKAREIFRKHFDIVQGDISDRLSLEKAMIDCYGVHINLKGGSGLQASENIEHLGTEAIVRAAKKQGLSRLTYLSGASVSEDRLWFGQTRAKYLAEQAIIQSGLEYAIFRTTWFMESLPLFVRGNKAIVMGKQSQKFHWVAAEDYAKMVARVFMMDAPIKKVLIVYGPEEYTFAEALEIFGKIAHPPLKVTNVPIGILRFFALATFNHRLKDVLPLMKYFEKNGELGDPAEADEILGGPRITLEKWAESYKEKSKFGSIDK